MKNIFVIILLMILTGCATTQVLTNPEKPIVMRNIMQKEFDLLPAPNGKKVSVAVYNFADKTGQRKPSASIAQLSTAVTQGAESFLIKALQDVGQGQWFDVVERVGIENLTKERMIIRQMREAYEGAKAKPLAPMMFAGMIIEGGIVGYDSNTQSGGQGARYFGIGLSEQYRVDQVTVSMRVVSVQTGEILLTTNVTKTIASHSSGGDVFRFLDMGTKALELETGVAVNEPVNYAIRTAIEFAVLELIHSGEKQGFWKFKEKEIEIPKVHDLDKIRG